MPVRSETAGQPRDPAADPHASMKPQVDISRRTTTLLQPYKPTVELFLWTFPYTVDLQLGFVSYRILRP